MATKSTRDIDWSVGRLSGGFTSSRRTPPAHHGSVRPCDWKLEEAEEGPLSERGEELARDLEAYDSQNVRPIVESIAPISMESAALGVSDALPTPPAPASRRCPSRAANAFWTGSATVMSVIALGLVVKLGFESAEQPSTPRASMVALASMAGSNEGVPFAARSTITLDPVFIDSSTSDSAKAQAAKASPAPAARTSARTSVAAVAPSPAAIAPQQERPSLAASLRAPAPISRPATAVAISVAGRRAVSCIDPGDPRSTMPVSVTFASSGRVTTATVDGGPSLGTTVGSCIARTLRTTTVAPFDGPPVTVHSSVRVR